MAKLNKVSLARKRELEQPDVILSSLQRSSLWVSLHRRQIITAAGAILAAVIIVIGGAYYFSWSEKTAFDRLSQIMPAPATDKALENKNTGTAADFLQLNEKYGGTLAGKIAGLKYADACYQSGEYDKAITAYQAALSDFKGNGFFKTMALNGLGYTYEAKKDYDQAVTCLKQIIDDPGAAVKSETLFNLGRLYALKGDAKNSQDMFNQVVKDYPDSFYAQLVREGENG